MSSQSKYNPTVKSSKVLICPSYFYQAHCESVQKPLSKEKLRKQRIREAHMKAFGKMIKKTAKVIDKAFSKPIPKKEIKELAKIINSIKK